MGFDARVCNQDHVKNLAELIHINSPENLLRANNEILFNRITLSERINIKIHRSARNSIKLIFWFNNVAFWCKILANRDKIYSLNPMIEKSPTLFSDVSERLLDEFELHSFSGRISINHLILWLSCSRLNTFADESYYKILLQTKLIWNVI